MIDVAVRADEREAQRSGTDADRALAVVQRMRTGAVSEERVRAAYYLGDPVAAKVLGRKRHWLRRGRTPERHPWRLSDMWGAALDRPLLIRLACDFVEHAVHLHTPRTWDVLHDAREWLTKPTADWSQAQVPATGAQPGLRKLMAGIRHPAQTRCAPLYVAFDCARASLAGSITIGGVYHPGRTTLNRTEVAWQIRHTIAVLLGETP